MLSDQFISRLVDRQDLQLEELRVPEPIGLPLHRLDLVVRPLHRTRRDHHIVVGQQTTPVRCQRLGHLLEDLDPRGFGALDPAIEKQRPERLARLLLLLANFGKDAKPEPVLAKISQETLADMIGTTRSRVSFFMNKFRKLGFIDYNGQIEVHSSLLNVVLHDEPHVNA